MIRLSRLISRLLFPYKHISCSSNGAVYMLRYHRYKSDSFRDGDGIITIDVPRPIAADLNGDGKPEIVAAVPGGRIHVLAPREHGNGFAPALLLGEVDLQEVWKDLGKNALESQEIVAFTVGYLTAKSKEFVRSPRKAVIGLVTSKGSVLLLDHNLKTLWVEELEHTASKDDRSWHVDHASILVTEHAANKDDKGMVVVGARIEAVDSKGVVDKLLNTHEGHGRDHLEGLHEVDGDSLHQYSYYAFNGNAGKRKWQHRPSDFHPDFQDGLLPTESSLHARAQLNEGIHHGETSCRNYRESILRALPHVWNAKYDSKLVLSHFRRHRSHSGQQKHTVGQAQMNHERLPSKLDPQLVPEPSSGLIGGRKRMRFHPNVVLAHTEEGIEALHLFSGRTVCRLPLQSGVVHADVNGDGIPDHIHAVGGNLRGLMQEAASEGTDVIGSHNRLLYCSATVSSGIPTRYRLWNGTICRHTVLGLHSASRDGIVLGVAPAAVLPDYGNVRKSSQKEISSLRRRNNVYFLNSVGDLSGYSSWGELMWQVSTGATWDVVPLGEDGQIIIDSDQDPENSKEDPSSEVPTLLPMTLRRHSTPTVILAAGRSYAAIVSERGHILASLSLPSSPIQPLNVIDYNLDGYMDVVLVAKEGLYGWTQVRRPGSISFGALVACLIVVMLAVFITQQSFGGQHAEAIREDGFWLKTRTARGRSTDRID